MSLVDAPGSKCLEASEAVLTFGPFEFRPATRVLFETGRQVRLGSRASEVLAALLERCGEVLTKRELLARAWPRLFVEESNLRVHIAVLRKILRDSHTAPRYIRSLSGRGYSFIAPVGRRYRCATSKPAASEARLGLLPTFPQIIGRAEAIEAITRQLKARRTVTIIGPGGIGKTTVALAAARLVAARSVRELCFVDLSAIEDSKEVPSTVATALSVASTTTDPIDSIVDSLRNASTLLILDNCEHVIDGAALLVERMLQGAPGVSLLMTSREALLVPGESLLKLDPLRLPAPTPSLTAAEARTYSAIELFVELATGHFDDFVLTDENVGEVATICSRLDGNPLAIELAAARVNLWGVRGLKAQLDGRLLLLSKGRRTAQRRHQSLRAALDWSYKTLQPDEQSILRRVSVFRNAFTANAAAAVVAGEKVADTALCEGLLTLVGKSLAQTEFGEREITYRLLEITRAYGSQLLESNPSERGATLMRYAAHLRALLAQAQAERDNMPWSEWVTRFGPLFDDVRATLASAFPDAARDGLTATALPLGFDLAQIEEFMRCAERALQVLATRTEVEGEDRGPATAHAAMARSTAAEGSRRATVSGRDLTGSARLSATPGRSVRARFTPQPGLSTISPVSASGTI